MLDEVIFVDVIELFEVNVIGMSVEFDFLLEVDLDIEFENKE